MARSVKIVASSTTLCLNTAAVTTGTLEEMHWEVLPHPAYSLDLVCKWISPVESTQRGGPRRKDLELAMKLNFYAVAGQTATNFFERNIMKLLKWWQQHIEVQEEYVEK